MEENGTEPKKAIFVDGENLKHMARGVFGVNVDFRVLLQILVEEIGQLKILAEGSPLIVTPESRDGRFEHSLGDIGFVVETIGTAGEADDIFIEDRIRAVDPKQVGEIIVVSADGRYIEELLRKREAGIKVYWVATKRLTLGDQKSMVGERLATYLGRELAFVELGDYMDRLTWSKYASKGPMIVLTINLEIRRPRADALEIAQGVIAMQERLKDLVISVKLTPVF